MLPRHGFSWQIISLFQSPTIKLHGCLWRTRAIISFYLYNYTLSWNKSIFANDVISFFVPTGSQALTKALSCRHERYPIGCWTKMELIHFIYFQISFLLHPTTTQLISRHFTSGHWKVLTALLEIKEEKSTVLFTFQESSSSSQLALPLYLAYDNVTLLTTYRVGMASGWTFYNHPLCTFFEHNLLEKAFNKFSFVVILLRRNK